MAEISGTGARDALNGGAAEDVISGRDGGDAINGGGGNDVLYGFGANGLDVTSGQIDAHRVASGLSNPLFAASPPGDPNRLFVVEQNTGRIRVLDLNSEALQASPFLDIPDSEMSSGGERGLLGLAFHPDYATNGLFYVNLTNPAGDTQIWQYRREDPNVAATSGRRLVLEIDQPFENHNGGWMAFGPDGYLYIATGDGGGAGDPQNNAQNTGSLLGKILRIDVNADAFPADEARNYAIPAGNPFAAGPGADEVWAYGLRNPWRPSFDGQRLFIADVGQGAREEVNVAPVGNGGFNFGWRLMEGNQPFSGTAPAGLTAPVMDYPHSIGRSITGGYVYHGPGGAQDLYVFGDFVTGALFTVRIQDGVAQDFLNRSSQLRVDAGDIDQIASFAVDGSGRLYLIGLDGDIHRLTPGIAAGDGPDQILGGDGDDLVFGGAGDDPHLNGNAGSDTINGNVGSDTVYGGAGNDQVYGGRDSDRLHGDRGDDSVFGDLGDDTLSGGPGADRFIFRGGTGRDRIEDFSFAEGDRLQLATGATWTVATVSGGAAVTLNDGAVVTLAGASAASVTADWFVFG
jgi:glucose/arabinose dehydrogenase